jgi:hypothetical protein
VAVQLKQKASKAEYVHCNAHRLSLALQKALSLIAKLRDALDTMDHLYVFIEASPKRHAQFQAIQKADDQVPVTLKRATPTRWPSRYRAVKAVRDTLPQIAEFLFKRDKTNEVAAVSFDLVIERKKESLRTVEAIGVRRGVSKRVEGSCRLFRQATPEQL